MIEINQDIIYLESAWQHVDFITMKKILLLIILYQFACVSFFLIQFVVFKVDSKACLQKKNFNYSELFLSKKCLKYKLNFSIALCEKPVAPENGLIVCENNLLLEGVSCKSTCNPGKTLFRRIKSMYFLWNIKR